MVNRGPEFLNTGFITFQALTAAKNQLKSGLNYFSAAETLNCSINTALRKKATIESQEIHPFHTLNILSNWNFYPQIQAFFHM